jgi:hypothetical protein
LADDPSKDLMERFFAVWGPSLDYLMVAHGAALLVMVSTYVGPDGIVPAPWKLPMKVASAGFLCGVLARVVSTIIQSQALTNRFLLGRLGMVEGYLLIASLCIGGAGATVALIVLIYILGIVTG